MKGTKMLAILVLRSELLRRVALVLALGLMVCSAKVSEATPMGTAFTYQGRLIDANSAADGLYDFEFKLFDDPNVILGAQVGSTIDVNELDVIDGYFTVELDFGSDVFSGDARWLEMTVAHGDGSDPCTLSPRQEITPVPYALQTRGIFVDDACNVGIGTTNPRAKLEVIGNIIANADYGFAIGSVSGFPHVYYSPINRYYFTDSSGVTTMGQFRDLYLDGVLQVGSTGNSYIRGNVGIGTISPAYQLDVVGDIRATGSFYGIVDNADKVDGYDAGNSSGQVAVSNGAVCTNLNADMLDGQTGSYYRNWDNLTNVPPGFADNIDDVGSGITLPYSGTTSSSSTAFSVTNSGTGNGIFVDIANTSTAKYAIKGRGPGRGIFGHATATSGLAYGVYGLSNSLNGIGVYAESPNAGVQGKATSTTAPNYGGWFESSSDNGRGVYAESPWIGVQGIATAFSGTNYGVYGATASSAGYAGYFSGRGYFSGSVGIKVTDPSEDLDVAGTARLRGIAGGGGWDVNCDDDGRLIFTISSRRYKKNIRDLEIDVDALLKLRPVTFQYKSSGQRDVGLIAEEVDEHVKDLVIYNKEGSSEAVKYDKVALYLLPLVKQLKAENELLKQRVEVLESAIRQLGKSKEFEL